MPKLNKFLSEAELISLSAFERRWLSDVFTRFNGHPSLEQLWALMDEVWDKFECDPANMNQAIHDFYSHPVWLLNGLFTERHELSLYNRELFADWVANLSPLRVAEIGGGFGCLARMIGRRVPKARVEIIEPHPNPVAIMRAKKSENVFYENSLVGLYDVMVATDVFEHVDDPLVLASETAQFLHVGGQYLIANCFSPVIKCHLPQTYHFRYSWDIALEAMGLIPCNSVVYGRVYIRKSHEISLERARRVEAISRQIWRFTKYLPGPIGRPLTRLINYFLIKA